MWPLKKPITSTTPVSPQDVQNCLLLLAFLESSFRGATISNLKIDDLAKSLKTVITAIK